MNESIILEVQGLTKQFGGLVAVNDISFQMQRRTIHALIGPNGSGKTTTLNMLSGVYPVNGGRIFFLDEDITGMPPHKIALLGVGRTFQNIKLFGTLTVLENMLIGADRAYGHKGLLHFLFSPRQYSKDEKAQIEKANGIMEYLGIYHLRNEVARNLAYGRQKVLELGRALMGDPSILLLDEPAAGLNPSERREFVEILQRTFANGVDLFLIEHNMDVVMNISHKISVLNFGGKIAEGTPSEIQNDPLVIKAYLGDRYKVKSKEPDTLD